MHLTPKEEDRLLLFLAAELARRRRDRGLRLSYPEARALIADTVVEAARDGVSVSEAAAIGSQVLTDVEVLPGVADLIGTLQVEGFFDDGQKLVTIHDPIRPAANTHADEEGAVEEVPGEILTEDGEIELNAGRRTDRLTVANTGDRPIQVGSHFHFYEVNRALRFDRGRTFGMHLDIPAGTAVRFEAGEEHDVALVEFGGTREVRGLNDMVNAPVDRPVTAEQLSRLRAAGFGDSGSDVHADSSVDEVEN
ncbi:urease subunit beta [Gordonia westfalica]|uniref:Urease subunit beta n=1 Tax=Gordonia westfalica TaxID=158898 RepID=A0ABU2GWH9_9ACTN|nr:urease subunit beta [Gordonia westfalica]MDS1115260.1 urease subunit beta [Gordonia westfalica]